MKRVRLKPPGPMPVKVKWDPDVPATIIRHGDEVSEVKFSDGRIRFIPNDQLKKSVAKRGG